MFTHKETLFFGGILLCTGAIWASDTSTTKVIVKTEKESTEYNMYDSGKMYFSEDYLVLDPLGDSNLKKVKLAEIQNLQFSPLSSSGIKDAQRLSNRIYPNPVTEQLIILSDEEEDFYYSIYSVDGKLVSSGRSRTGEVINVASLATGIYEIKFNNQNLRFIKQ
ncbi:MAG: T9SS type A sorting domain-containing protein [Paludibacteraceae bacterium]|nr:T9SS type A sorting domain-containing protein [Paludibacteraceae bacterium]